MQRGRTEDQYPKASVKAKGKDAVLDQTHLNLRPSLRPRVTREAVGHPALDQSDAPSSPSEVRCYPKSLISQAETEKSSLSKPTGSKQSSTSGDEHAVDQNRPLAHITQETAENYEPFCRKPAKRTLP